jgi:exopolysaccharide biosynthesis polyprenyl glycosylphosphotransferase
MGQYRRRLLLVAFKLLDLLIVIAIFLLATLFVYHKTDFPTFYEFLQLRIKVANFFIFIGYLCLWHGIFSMFGMYRSRRLSSLGSEIKDLLLASILGTIIAGLLGRLLSITVITLPFLAILFAGVAGTTIVSRVLIRYLLRKIRLHGRNLRSLLVVGTNPRAIQFAKAIEAKPDLGYQLVGFVDEQWSGIDAFNKSGYKLVCDFDGFVSFLRNHVVDEVLISLPMQSLYSQSSQLMAICENQGIIVRYLPGIFNSKIAHYSTENLGDMPLVSFYTGACNGWQAELKRIMDIVIAAILLVPLAPLFLLTALLIKLDTPGPVFFIQERVGFGKRKFRLFKFRTMVDGASKLQDELEVINEASGPVFKIKNDRRITRVGKYLRKTSIDELPQLINVLKGDMSIVGPRPLPVRDYNGFSKDWHRRRFSVRPGITCIWQVQGRSDIPFEKWMELDMEYIDRWSLWLDLKILIKTIPVVFKGTGAV